MSTNQPSHATCCIPAPWPRGQLDISRCDSGRLSRSLRSQLQCWWFGSLALPLCVEMVASVAVLVISAFWWFLCTFAFFFYLCFCMYAFVCVCVSVCVYVCVCVCVCHMCVCV